MSGAPAPMTFGLFPPDRPGRSLRQRVTAWSSRGERVRRAVTAATSLCLLLAGTSLPARAAGNSPPVAVDDPGPACGPPAAFGGSYPVPEDWHDWSFLALGARRSSTTPTPTATRCPSSSSGSPRMARRRSSRARRPTGSSTVPIPTTARPSRRLGLGRHHLPRVRRAGVLQRGELPAVGRADQRPADLHARSGPDRDPGRRRAGLGPVGDGHLARAGQRERPARARSRSTSARPTTPSAVKPAIDGDGVLTFTPGTKPWLTTDLRSTRRTTAVSRTGTCPAVLAVRQARRHQRPGHLRDRDPPCPAGAAGGRR